MDADAKFELDAPQCPVYHVTRDQINSTDFLHFVQKVFRSRPDVPMFKIVPPTDWKPTQRRPNLDSMTIQTPIKQLAFGKTGSYRCVLVEDKPCSVAQFRDLANSEDRMPPAKCRKDYKMLERAFWKSVTMNAPLYGADTPVTLFGQHCKGWSLCDLADLLKQKGVAEIPGVTTPMSYFGMWKSFFAWHIEDADLYSVNYLHWGSPKVWYCVPPSGKAKFERLAACMHPDAYRACKGFLRHKDILISPSILKQYNVGYHVCKQNPGEYVVLNAAAYHSGFNTGFNVAEAVNFATDDWIEMGRKAVPCTCGAMSDKVRIDMALFGERALSVASQSVTRSSDSAASDAEAVSSPSAEEASGGSDMSESDIVSAADKLAGKRARTPQPAHPASPGAKRHSGHARVCSEAQLTHSPATHAAVPAATPPATKCTRSGRKVTPPAQRLSTTSQAAAKPLRAAALKLNVARKQCSRNDAVMEQLGGLPKPVAVVYDDAPKRGSNGFDLLVPLEELAAGKRRVRLQYLREGRDGLYRPCSSTTEEARSSLVPIRTQLVDPSTRKPGFKLLTLRSRILSTELR